MTILLGPQEVLRQILDPRERIVIPTGAQRSGGTCGCLSRARLAKGPSECQGNGIGFRAG
jgi:hypothetical protein